MKLTGYGRKNTITREARENDDIGMLGDGALEAAIRANRRRRAIEKASRAVVRAERRVLAAALREYDAFVPYLAEVVVGIEVVADLHQARLALRRARRNAA